MDLTLILCLVSSFLSFCNILKYILKQCNALCVVGFSISVVFLSVYMHNQFGMVSIFRELTQLFIPANCNVGEKGIFLFRYTLRNVSKTDTLHRLWHKK